MQNTRLYILIILVTVSVNAFPQTTRFFSVDKELSSSLVYDIMQDHYGQIWIATGDGLNKYDASNFTVYKKNKNRPGQVANNFSRIIFEDSQKNLLIGFGRGLQQYDFATNSFKDIPLISEEGDSLTAYVTSILELSSGEIIIGTSGFGIFSISQNDGLKTAHFLPEVIPSLFIETFYEDRFQNLWITTQDKGLFCINQEKGVHSYFTNEDGSGIIIRCLSEDLEGNLYVGSNQNGIFKFDRNEGTFNTISCNFDADLPINTLFTSRNGDILIGTEGEGLKIFDPKSHKVSNGNFNISTFDFSSSKITSILEDKEGNIWLGVFQKGVVMLPASSSNFQYIGHKSIKNNIIGSNNVTSLYADQNNWLWVGTDGDGIYKLEGNGRLKAHFKNAVNYPNMPSTIMTIFEDSQENIWLGSYDKGLVKMDRNTGQCELMNKYLDRTSHRVIPIYSIVEDKNQNLWIGTLGAGMYCMNLKTGQTEYYSGEKDPDFDAHTDQLINRFVNPLLLSSDEKLYTGTVIGLGCLDLKTHSFVTGFGVNRILPDQLINTLFEDDSGNIWIGTAEGLFCYHPDSNRTTSYTTEDGIQSNVINSIVEDQQHNIWVSTNYGISKLDPQNGTFTNYFSYDGLQGNEFASRSMTMKDDGRIFFGGLHGITHFNPLEIKGEGKKMDVFLTGFYIHDQEINQATKSGRYDIIDSPLIEADEFHLHHEDNSFTIEFSSMDYTNPERIQYMYKIGNDVKWIMLRPGINDITFNNLSPDTYTLKIRAKDYNTYSDEKCVSIIIHPAWYLTNGAKAAYIIIFGLFVTFIALEVRQRRRTRQEMQEHIHAEQINEAKVQFFINMAHEIRTPLSLIINPLKKLIDRDENSERRKSYLTMNRNSERILHLVNQMMDIQKIDKGQMGLRFEETEIVAYVRDLCGIFNEQLKMNQIELNYQNDLEKLNIWIDPYNFDKVILNVLSNAIKFTPNGGKINVSVGTGLYARSNDDMKNYAQIAISDSGIGIPPNELEKVFDCFYQVRDEKHKSFDGTGIGLHLSRSIVELHHGFIHVENNSHQPGCRFIIQLPLGNKHLDKEEISTDLTLSKESNKRAKFSPSTHYAEGAVAKSKSKIKILVVDDDQDILEYISRELALQYQVAQCSNGKEALSFALKNAPDLIISDVVMPEMDGITLCRKIKQNVNINHIPVILLTARTNEEDNLEGLGIGADAYMTKPFNIEILKKTAQNIIKNRQILRNNFSGGQEQNDKVKRVSMKSPDEKLLLRVIDVVNDNIGNPELHVEMLAREIGISRVHLHRKLKELTNQSTRDFIRNIRLHQAANLLSDKSMNISEVAFAVGFSNVAHFSNSFKEFYGMPPTSYMESRLKQINE